MLLKESSDQVDESEQKLIAQKNSSNKNAVVIKMSNDSCRNRKQSFSSHRLRNRIFLKQGTCNVVQGDVTKRRKRYMQDIFTTLVDAQWRWMSLVFTLSFLISWSLFSLVWWAIAHGHGDIAYLQHEDRMREMDSEWKPPENDTHILCVTDVRGLASAFLFSVEMQHTIGYGNRYITEECMDAIAVMSIQSVIGVFIQAFMVGIVFAKLSRPKQRARTLLFSKVAVVCHRDGAPCLIFRVGDIRRSHMIEVEVRAQFIRRKITKEGEELPFYQQKLKVGADWGEDRLMFIWPTSIVHKIDKDSPLYNLSAEDILRERFEIVVMLEGVVESTGMTTQARYSYLPSEILWGHRFEHVVSFRKETAEYEVDFSKFNNTIEVNTPLCSSKQLNDVRSDLMQSQELEQYAIDSSDGTIQSVTCCSHSSKRPSNRSSAEKSNKSLRGENSIAEPCV